MRCPTCGQNGLVYDDNWGENPVLRELNTNEIHPHSLPKSRLTRFVEESVSDDYWVCFHHGTRLDIGYSKMRCPVKDCPQNNFGRNSYFKTSGRS